MRNFRLLLVILLWLGTLTISNGANGKSEQSAELTKEIEIKYFLFKSGTLDMMHRLMVAQYSSLYRDMAKSDPKMTKEIIKLLDDKTAKFYRTKIFDEPHLQDSLIKVYDNYYSQKEITELIAFYDSPVGKKSIELMPKITADSFKAGEFWGKNVGEEFRIIIQKEIAELKSQLATSQKPEPPPPPQPPPPTSPKSGK